ncbi:hypothetical protein [Methylocucumis oryzae]|uniref:Filamentous haemagglutinin FhaB/tRNA nuclease CdiA-like TPS domain-containing protein n=1 Tax=Methylocucumis oryzae TaxID=1632867 RepID=A0A0F3IL85_9GAMM|nr:hypothetical protein [Methylocucumis oryzae]KJV07437.1 hypothetical protein VZ94_04725 [Methylocucumis oryzae]
MRALSGQLILNSTGNIQFNQSLTDGFKDGTLALESGGSLVVRDMLQTDDSWSYQVTAGADLTSADTNATAALSHLTVGSGVTVRTGTGDIRLNAGGDVVLTDQTSTIYSAGRAESNSRYGALSNDAVGFVLFSEYPVDGGELSINAGRNVVGAVSDQFINNWLLRIGNWTDSTTHSGEKPTAWGVALGYVDLGRPTDATKNQFQQNIGSFGGGKVDINAGGDIQDLTVVMPTTGKQLYQNGLTADNSKPNEVVINGGGTMRINAGGDISGGTYYLGQGEATVSAGGDITGSNSSATDKLVFSQGPQLLMGDSTFTLNASGNVSLTAVSDAMVLHSGSTNFFSYGADSALTINSLAGDISLGADTSVIGTETGFSQTDNQGLVSKIYPASLATTAFGGSVYIENDITLYPSSTGNLSIFAANNITSTSDTIAFNMSDADASLLPHYEFPVSKASLKDAAERLSPLNLQRLIHATTPVHTGDDEPVRLVTLNGKIGDIDSLGFYLPKKAIVQSGDDIKNTLLTIQHVNEDDVSIISAGRDLVYTSVRSQNGEVTQNVNGINIMGTGDVLIKAGRNIDLGSSNGILTTANAFNSFLSSDKGANATLIAGLNSGDADYSAFCRYCEVC